jgi:ethanolamine-phosphate phospho-lyase
MDEALSVSMALFLGTALIARRYCSTCVVAAARNSTTIISSHPPPASLKEAFSLNPDQVETLRYNHMSCSCSVSYKNTGGLHIIGGYGARLIDVYGHEYLDTRNNVAHCGHGHPDIVEAITYQMKLINTNSRYLHPHASLLATKLTSLFPKKVEENDSVGSAATDSLTKVFFVNSGSEANDLALRLARAYCTKQQQDLQQHRQQSKQCIITIDHAYHGHTLATLDVSPYKHHQGKEITECPAYVKRVPYPDVYRGIHSDCNNEIEAAERYAAYVEDACSEIASNGDSVSAFIMEGGMSVAGVILPPKSYLRRCIRAVRDNGGLYIADEVQTGFGRLGKCMWAFEYSNDESDVDVVLPDIVTVGKPFGNGMPLAAVITTPKVASAFESLGVEYFNTFAGSPVCCAAGLSMIHVLTAYQLQKNAFEVGNVLKNMFSEVKERHSWIGDIRGSGLFIGIELVRNQYTLEPATEETSFVCSVLKDKYKVLTSIDGYHENVIVVKPPMVFTKEDAIEFVTCFENSLVDLSASADELHMLGKTPT